MKIKQTLKAVMVASLVLAGCSSNAGKKDVPVVSVAQIVSHPSLNTIRDNFSAQMEELGYKDGDNIILNYADASGEVSNLNSIINQFEDDQSDVIVAIATPTAQAAANVSDTIPVVFSAVSDPIGAKLVSDMEKPGGNITGTSDEVQVDQILDLARIMVPEMKTVGFLYNASEANSVSNLKKVKEYCDANGLELIEATGKDITELETSASVLCEKVDVLFAPNDNTVASAMQALSKTALDANTPFFVGADSMVADGGLATVGIDYADLGKETANMVDEILKGKKAGDIPVKVFKDNLNVYVNKKAMEKLGLELPEEVANNEKLQIVE